MRTRFLQLVIAAVAARSLAAQAAPSPLDYRVDLRDAATHHFHVTLTHPGLGAGNAVYQFAATAPGTYQTMNIGRFVSDFRALDRSGAPIPVEHVSENQWRIGDPARVETIAYDVAPTWESKIPGPSVYPMCGTMLAADHALFNGHAVIGYPTGMQARPVALHFDRPAGWTVGTSMRTEGETYRTDTFDELVDTPILFGSLTSASLSVTGVPVRIFVWSATGKVAAPQLAASMTNMLQAAGSFIGKLPVDRYTFLYIYPTVTAPGTYAFGAWEHSYGSEYVIPEAPFSPAFGQQMTDLASHEFFHVITPLNIHSEIIERFNFVTPVPSDHLWLYEGTTEWAAQKMQLESGLKSPEAYLAGILQKARTDKMMFDTTWSLVKLARTSFSDSGQKQYGNIYMRGALVAGLLDIRLLELSGGTRGLRDEIRALSLTFGKRRAFPEKSFVDTLVAHTDPAVADFFRRYVYAAEPLPIREYYAKLGIRASGDVNGLPAKLELDPNPTEAQLRLRRAWLGQAAGGSGGGGR